MSRSRIFLTLVLLAVSYTQASETDVFLIGSVDGRVPRQETAFLLNSNARLVLTVVLIEQGRQYSAVNSFDAQGGLRPVPNRLPSHLGISWYQVKPKLKEYSNLWKPGHPDVGDIHLEPIEYEIVPMTGCRGQDSVDISTLLPPGRTGTFYFAAEIDGVKGPFSTQLEGFAESSPLHLKYRYRIIQVVRGEDDSYLGYLSELFGTPFVIGPRMTDQGVNETDARMGSDCAAFAIYGKRRQGFRVPYCGPLGIYRYLSAIEDMPLRPIPFDQTGVYATPDNRFIRIGPGGLQAGDIVHFGEQVSVFYGDVGIKGVLDKDDLLLQCYGSQPTITTVGDSGFYHLPVRIFKWRDDLKKAVI
ncbi:MAG: hypothetical protein WCC00_01760 [Candidatus Aminicenantales bacterium]